MNNLSILHVYYSTVTLQPYWWFLSVKLKFTFVALQKVYFFLEPMQYLLLPPPLPTLPFHMYTLAAL